MPADPLDHDSARDALARGTERLAALLASGVDPGTRLPGSEWDLQAVATHVLSAFSDYGEALAGTRPLGPVDPALGPTNAQMRAVNEQRMAAIEDRDLGTLADRLRAVVSAFLEATAGQPPDRPFTWYQDRPTTLGAMTGLMLGEVLLHGYDIAQALRRPWPIAAPDATAVILGAVRLLPAYVDADAARGVRASYLISLRGGPRFGVRFADGQAEVQLTPSGRYDCRLSVDPTAMLLVSYGRQGPLRPALTGKIVAWGRKPWLGLRFPTLLTNP